MSSTSVITGTRLQDKVAVIFGAGGDIGAGVAAEFASQGASLYLSGRTLAHVQSVADTTPGDGKAVRDVAELDALDERAVDDYLDRVVRTEGRIDVVFNAMGPRAADYGNGTSAMELPFAKFMHPINTIVASQFITARSAARHLVSRGSGTIVFLSATVSRGTANTSAIGAAYGALEAMTRSLATELSPHGVRVVCVCSMGMAETRTMRDTHELGGAAMGVSKERVAQAIQSRALLGRSPSVTDTAKLVAFVASDDAAAMTGAIVNSSAGQVLD